MNHCLQRFLFTLNQKTKKKDENKNKCKKKRKRLLTENLNSKEDSPGFK